MKFRTTLLLLAAAAALLTACKGNPGKDGGSDATDSASQEQTTEQTTMTETPAETPKDIWADLGEEPLLKIKTTDGTMTVKLYGDTPLHRDNFVKLASTGFYNGTIFHRVIKGFMIQAGDPYTKDTTMVNSYGTGGPDYTIPAEIVEGKTHKKGALAAARRGDAVNPAKESSGSQFYIVQDAAGCSHLDGEYTIFGEVVEGFDVIDKIANERTGRRDLPLERIEIISVLPITE